MVSRQCHVQFLVYCLAFQSVKKYLFSYYMSSLLKIIFNDKYLFNSLHKNPIAGRARVIRANAFAFGCITRNPVDTTEITLE